MKPTRLLLLLAALCLAIGAGRADASEILTLLLEDFEDGAVGYTLSEPEVFDGDAYFTRAGGTGGATLPGTINYGTPNGSGGTPNASGGYFAAQETNIGQTGLSFDTATMMFSGIDISMANLGLEFSGLFSEDDTGTEDWDANTSLRVDAQIDGGGFFQIFGIESSAGDNSAPAVDTNLDGTGDGTVITDSFTAFTAAIAGAGNLLDLRITFDLLNTAGKDIAFDDITVTGVTSAPEPSSLLLLGTLAICGCGYRLRRDRNRQSA